MAALCNQLNKKDALKKLAQESFARCTLSFYRYVSIENPNKLRDELFQSWNKLEVLGRVYLAPEGINAQISVPEPSRKAFEEALNEMSEFQGVPFKFAVQDGISFWKLAIRIKKQIVADGLSASDYQVSNVGKHLSAQEWNEAMADEDTVVVDMRNHYESRIGRFEGAIIPTAETFREALPMAKELLKGQEKKKILLYCTGGIRCEKASSYLKSKGFSDVNQLFGGIIEYTHQVRKKGLRSAFKGKNFVFDERLEEVITPDVLTTCDQCKTSCDRYVNCSNTLCNLLFIQCSPCQGAFHGACSRECEAMAQMPLDQQRLFRAGKKSSKRFVSLLDHDCVTREAQLKEL